MWPFSLFGVEKARDTRVEDEFKRRKAPDGTEFIDWPCGCVTIKHVSKDGTGTRKKRISCRKHKKGGGPA
jgi:hypothetical protein